MATLTANRPQLALSKFKSPQPTLSKADMAQQSVAAKPASADGPVMSPSLESILKAFQDQGSEDKEMLKLLLQAKAKEDERLAALDAFRAEQLRAANTLAMQQSYYQYQQLYAVAAIAQQQAAAMKGLAPYSPTSPPPSTLAPPPSGTKRPRAPSDASSTASSSSSANGDSSKKAKTSSISSASGKPTHEDVMVALRQKIQGRSPSAQAVPLPPMSQTGYSPQPPQARLIAPRTSLSPPLAGAITQTTTGRRTSPPHIPGRHTSLLRAAAPANTVPSHSVGAKTPSPAPGSPPLPSLAEEHIPSTPRKGLELLLHASESTEVASPAWQPAKPTVLAATSDCRGEA
ncbi:hypothetical protein JCM11251_005241 [Rhodosporidiobolus azoricus]